MSDRDHFIGPGMQKELGDPDPGVLVYGGVAAPADPAHRYIRIELLPPLQYRGERSLEYQASGRHPPRQIHRHSGPERVPEDQYLAGSHPQLLTQVAVGGVGILIQAGLARGTLTLSVAPVVEG